MNERIKELVGQAKFMAEETINKQISVNAELNAFAEKFAVLVILECSAALNKNYPPDDDLPIGEVMYCLKDHFGIE